MSYVSHDDHRSKIEKTRWGGKVLCSLLILLYTVTAVAPLTAGGDLREPPPRSAGMGGSGCALPGAGFASLNPALITFEATGGAVWWTPSRFGVTELGAIAAEWNQGFSGISAGAALQRFGYDVYSEHRFDVSAGAWLGSGLALGMRGSLNTVHILRYGNAVAMSVDAGLHFSPASHWHAAAVIRNLAAEAFADDESIPLQMRIGAAWTDERLLLACDLEKDARYPLTVRAGVEFRPVPLLALRVGAVNTPALFTAGAGLLLSSVQAQYAVSVHPDLGWTHSIGIGFQP